MSDPLISVVIPVYNEEVTVLEVIKKVLAALTNREIIVVDDCSTDKTWEALQKGYKNHENVILSRQEINQGKGAALRAGFAKATGEIIIIQDADLEYTPDDYPVLLRPILRGQADVVYGSRFLGSVHRVLYFWHYLGNKALTLLCNMMSNLNLNDMETCYKVFRRDVIKDVHFRSNRFGFEPEFTIKMAKKQLRIYEVPIHYYGRSYAEGKKITWVDGFKAIFAIVYFRFFD